MLEVVKNIGLDLAGLGLHPIERSRGEIIQIEDELITQLRVLTEGSVLAENFQSNGRSELNAVFQAPSLMGVFPDSYISTAAPYQITAADQIKFYKIQKSEVETLMYQFPEVQDWIFEALRSDINNITQLNSIRAKRFVQARIAGAILYLAQNKDLTSPISQEKFGELAVVSRPWVSTHLNHFGNKSLIKAHRGMRYEILERKKLTDIFLA